MKIALIGLLLLPCSFPAMSLAQDAPATDTVAADLQAINKRADEMPVMRNLIEQYRANARAGPGWLANAITNSVGGRFLMTDGDFPYRIYFQYLEAQERARRLSVIMASDLDGDGSVSRQEIADTLTFTEGQAGGAAEALVRYDANRDDILSPEEIRAALAAATDQDSGRRKEIVILSGMFDFDDDGTVTATEFRRAEDALRFGWEGSAPP